MFLGYYQWDTSEWWYSTIYSVRPGDTLSASVVLDAGGQSYTQSIRNARTGDAVSKSIAIEPGKGPYSDAYFVVEHQPSKCSQLPANGGIVFRNITIQYADAKPSSLRWSVAQYRDACNCTATTPDAGTVAFTWQTQ